MEESFPISEQGYTVENYWMEQNVKYLHCKSLHSLPRFASRTQRIKVGSGQLVSVLFIIPIIVDIHGHRFEIYTLVSEIHENIALVLGIKNKFELEGIINHEIIALIL